MNFKKLCLMLAFLFVLGTTTFAQPYPVVYVDATNGSDAYTGQNETNNPAMSGPKATFAAARAIIQNGGTIVIKAGTYAEALDFSTGLPGAAPNNVLSYTLQLKQLNANTDVVFTGVVGGNHAVINKAGLTVNITQFGTTERLVINPAAAADPTIALTLGTINMASSSMWSITLNAGGNQDEVKFNIGTGGVAGGKFGQAAPAVTLGTAAPAGIVLTYLNNANYTAGAEASYANFGSLGQINVNTAAAANTITFPSAVVFTPNDVVTANTLDVINITQGGASFPSTINLGRGDIINAGGGTMTVTGLVSAGMSAGAGVLDADLSSVRNTGGGTINLNGGITWTGGDFGGAKTYAALYAVDNVGTGSINTGAVNLIASNAATVPGVNDYSFGFNNVAGASLTVGLVTADLSGTNNFSGQLTLINAGTATVAGGRYRGAFTNIAGGVVNVNGNTTVDGVLSNAGSISLGANSMTLTTSQAHLTNGGTVTASTGGLIVTTTAAGNSFDGGTLSNVTINGAGSTTTFQTNNVSITTLTVTSGIAVVNVNVTATTVDVNGGRLDVNNTRTLTVNDLFESAGIINLGTGASGVIDVKRHFSRTGGTFVASAGSLMSFTGTVTQNVDGGPLFQLVNLTFTNSVSPINVGNTIRVSGAATISTATTVNFGTVNLVLNSATASIVNNGIYNTTENSGGGVILGGANLVPLGFAGGGQTIEGTGIFSYITVDVGNTLGAAIGTTGNTAASPTVITTGAAHGLVTGDVIYYIGSASIPAGYYGVTVLTGTTFSIPVNALANDGAVPAAVLPMNNAKVINTFTGVKFNGVLRLYTGALSVATAGVDFSPFGTNAKVVRHMYNFAGGVPQPVLVAQVGTWDAAAVQYDLEYATGTAIAAGNSVDILLGSTEFPNVANRIRNLSITATSVLTGSLQLTAARSFVGNLTVAAGSVLGLTGALTSSAAAGTHVVSGDIIQNAAALGNKLVFTGGGTLTGGTGNSNIVAVDFNTSGTYTVTAMKALGANAATNAVAVLGGATVNLGMANLGTTAAPNWGDVTNLTVTNGRVNLTSDIDVTNLDLTLAATGTLDFGNYNIWWKSAGTFTGVAASTYLATGATTGGYLQIRANSNINTGGSLVPRIIFDPEALGAFTLTLTGNTGVSDILTNTGNDILELAGFTFRHGGNTWNHGGTATYPSTAGNGIFSVTGNVTANLGANATLPNLTVNNGTNTFTLVDNDGVAGTVPSITITDPGAAPGVFIMTAGNVNLNACDIIMTDAGTVFTYAAGTFTATSAVGVTGTDAARDRGNGELVFNHAAAAAQSISLTATCTVPNVRVVGTIGQNFNHALANGFNLKVANRFVFGEGHTINLNAAAGSGNLEFGDGCFVERRAIVPTWVAGAWVVNYAGLAQNPVFPTGVIDLFYNVPNTVTGPAGQVVPAAPPTYLVAREMPAAGTVLRNLYISMGVNTHSDNTGVPTIVTPQTSVLAGSKNVKVNNLLHLIAGNYDPEPAATTYTLEMGANATVQVTNGHLLNNLTLATNTFWLTGGPVTLIYDNDVYRLTEVYEFPATAGFVSVLDVRSNTGATTEGLRLHAARSVGDLILNTGAAGVNDVRFNLHGRTLSVTNVASATLTRGILSSESVAAGLYTYATLAVTGSATSTANASVQNVNVTAATVNFAGPFGQTDWEGTGAAPNLPASVTGVTTTGTSTIATFNGNLTSPGLVTINGPHTNGTITASTDVTVGTGGSMAASSNLTFIGTANSTLTVPAAGANIGALTLNKTNNTNTITLAGGNLATNALTTFVNGLFVTGNNTLRMFHPLFAAGGQGFNRDGVTGTNISHVVGNVAKASVNGGGPGLANSSVPRFEFPVGTMTLYRPVAITFNPSFGLPTMPNATTFTVSHVNSNPGGAVELPIKDGVAPGIDVARYPSFYWTIKATPNSIGPSTLFDLELTATGFTDFDDINNVRIIRRHGLVTDQTNQWILQGLNDQYDNEVNAGVPSIIQKNANAGLRSGGAVFTLGLKSNMKIKTTIPKQWLVLSAGAKNYSLANLFEGNIGSLSYTAQSSNTSIATVAVSGTTLTITPVAIGDAVVTVIASDAANNDFFAYSFPVNVGLVGVEDGEIIPTEFSLSQNFPNPFNPTTNIKFGLPKESNVTLRIFNILGEEVATLVNKVMPAGFHTVTFDASRLTSGLYIYRIEADNFVQVKKMMLMK